MSEVDRERRTGEASSYCGWLTVTIAVEGGDRGATSSPVGWS
ncbi:hypothetical protein [Croceicoccus pelagius]|nr:hypothetical protein [Croceicoccus pelagius]